VVSDLWTLAPAIALAGYFGGALMLFAVTRGRVPVEAEVASRPASRLLGRWIRQYMMWVLGPYERALARLGVSPNAITLFALGLSLLAAVALGAGWFALGGWLYLAAGMCDILDGRVARRAGRVSRGGAFFDSVIDRYAEIAVFGGLAWYYRDSWALVLVLASAAGSVMVSYTRARGEALGVDVSVGTMQRPERLFYLGVVVAHSPLWERLIHPGLARPMYAPTLVALALLGASANVTAIRRIVHTLRALAVS
jgi:phosphatidylglycerophosphate synthase